MNDVPRDEQLWRLAKKRASFQRSLAMYVIFSALFWVIWYVTAGRHGGGGRIPWPVWPMLGWGIGILFQYMDAYGGSRRDLEEREYQKLKEKQDSARL
jgi:hypothetical protein